MVERLRSLAVGFVGTYPPTRCGIATFTASLARAIVSVNPYCRFGVVVCVDPHSGTFGSSEVVAQLVRGSAASRAAAVERLNEFDVVVVQHEFGIYGGEDGGDVLDLVREVRVPVIAVLHTVPRRPTLGQRRVLEELAVLADRVVVQSAAARTRLLEQYVVDAAKLRTIPHGAHDDRSAPPPTRDGCRSPVVMTWGLFGPDKGIEWGIDAIAQLADMKPPPRYVVVGQTHPRVLETQGEEYRDTLVARAAARGVGDLVEFDNAYYDTASLLERVRRADIVLLPYSSREQVVSGVLVEAIASGKPVVATAFPHAQELLAVGSGIVVPHEDPEAIADAIRSLLVEPERLSRTAAVARRQARTFFWEKVGERYLALAAELTRSATKARAPQLPAPRFEHLLEMSDGVGVFEHAKLTAPRLEHGYCTDDVARALVALMREPTRPAQLERLAAICLAFLERAQCSDGRFRNRLSVEGQWLDAVGFDDTTGRALWAAGTTAALARSSAQRERALALFEAGAEFRTSSPRANAFAALGAAALLATAAPPAAAYALLERATAGLGRVLPDPEWPWPETRLAYANAVLAEARIAYGAVLGDDRLLVEGLDLLAWLVRIETRGDHFSFTPVGGWAPGEPRPGFDQQPIEAATMTDACARAFDVTDDKTWAETALRAAAWFLGANDVGASLLDAVSGGGRDGLEPDGVNENEGAESTLALITALQQARRLQAAARNATTSADVSTLAAPMQRSAAP
jgi:glycosyltransferase involved in cell wall biosynthesis